MSAYIGGIIDEQEVVNVAAPPDLTPPHPLVSSHSAMAHAFYQ